MKTRPYSFSSKTIVRIPYNELAENKKNTVREQLIYNSPIDIVASNTGPHLLTIQTLASVPCFECLIRKKVTPFFCNPEKCESLEKWLFEETRRKGKVRVFEVTI